MAGNQDFSSEYNKNPEFYSYDFKKYLSQVISGERNANELNSSEKECLEKYKEYLNTKEEGSDEQDTKLPVDESTLKWEKLVDPSWVAVMEMFPKGLVPSDFENEYNYIQNTAKEFPVGTVMYINKTAKQRLAQKQADEQKEKGEEKEDSKAEEKTEESAEEKSEETSQEKTEENAEAKESESPETEERIVEGVSRDEIAETRKENGMEEKPVEIVVDKTKREEEQQIENGADASNREFWGTDIELD